MFDFSRRKAQFGQPNIRYERHGDELLPAFDLPISFTVSKADMINLFPLENEKGSVLDGLWDKEGHFKTAYISSIPIDRKPEGLNVCLIDNPANASKPKKTPQSPQKPLVVRIKNVTNDCIKSIHLNFSKRFVPGCHFKAADIKHAANDRNLVPYRRQVSAYIIAARTAGTFIGTEMLMNVNNVHHCPFLPCSTLF